MRVQSYRIYLVTTLTLILLGVVGVALWNGLVDPWGVYHADTEHGWNHYKPTEGKHDRMIKAMQIRTRKPDALLLGSSRVDWGLDEFHSAITGRCDYAYNAGLAGATMYEVLRMAQHAQAIQSQKFMVVGLDVEMFAPASKVQWSFEDARMATDEQAVPRWLPPWKDHTQMLLSTYALKQNKKTRKLSRKQTHWTREQLTRRGSAYFEQKEEDYYRRSYPFALKQISANLGRLPERQDAFVSSYMYFRQLLVFAHERGIKLYLYIHPYHASALDVMKQRDSWETFEQWKKDIAKINREVAETQGRAKAFRLRDYSGYHIMATEPLPWPSEHPGPMKWYFESSHFRKVLGDRILSALIDDQVFEPEPNE